ncbi:MAG: hypothetical protein QF464_24730, partial [Myxococcota bacterium]|nr:hypothetical protein [Myxococcota bacterium]
MGARARGDLDLPRRALANDLLAAVPRGADGRRPAWYAEASARPGERAFLARLAVYSGVCNVHRGAAPRQKGRVGECIAFPQRAALPHGVGDEPGPQLMTFVQEGPAPPQTGDGARDAALIGAARATLERQRRRRRRPPRPTRPRRRHSASAPTSATATG